MGYNRMDASVPNPQPLPHGFDPFNDRPSRTVRNRLSARLQDCIANREIFGDAPQDLVRQFPQPPYARYIQDRVARYRSATHQMLTHGGNPLTQAVILWRHGLPFEAHEVLEPCWLAATGREREGLKGLIQAIAVDVHQEAGHTAAAERLARKAVQRLRWFGDAISEKQAINIDQLVTRLTLLSNPTRHEEA